MRSRRPSCAVIKRWEIENGESGTDFEHLFDNLQSSHMDRVACPIPPATRHCLARDQQSPSPVLAAPPARCSRGVSEDRCAPLRLECTRAAVMNPDPPCRRERIRQAPSFATRMYDTHVTNGCCWGQGLSQCSGILRHLPPPACGSEVASLRDTRR